MIQLIADLPAYARIGVACMVALVAFPLAGLAARAVRNAAKKTAEERAFDPTIVTFGAELVRVVFLVCALLLVLTLAGVQSTSLAAVLGAATLAIGLAMQATLANVAAGVLIFIFRPFRVGEFVELANKQGRVKLLSLFTTELESAQGLSFVIANAQVMTQPITNFTRNKIRRVDIDVMLHWSSDTNVAIAATQKTLKGDPRIQDDPAPIALIRAIGDKGPILSVRAWTEPEHSAELSFDLAQKVHKALQTAGIRSADASA